MFDLAPLNRTRTPARKRLKRTIHSNVPHDRLPADVAHLVLHGLDAAGRQADFPQRGRTAHPGAHL
jgi:hypothetical protein